jgi:hypothetical protein
MQSTNVGASASSSSLEFFRNDSNPRGLDFNTHYEIGAGWDQPATAAAAVDDIISGNVCKGRVEWTGNSGTRRPQWNVVFHFAFFRNSPDSVDCAGRKFLGLILLFP